MLPLNKNGIRANRARQKLIKNLGGKCVRYGTETRLELHHIGPRTWVANKKSRWTRVVLYRKDIETGRIQLLCRRCHNFFHRLQEKKLRMQHKIAQIAAKKIALAIAEREFRVAKKAFYEARDDYFRQLFDLNDGENVSSTTEVTYDAAGDAYNAARAKLEKCRKELENESA